jgi:hypothetical protein
VPARRPHRSYADRPAHGEVLALDGPAEQAFDRVDDLQHRRLTTARDVVNAAGYSGFRCGDGRLHRIGHVGEVPALEPVADQRQRLPGERVRDEAVESHVGTLPGPEDGEVTQHHHRDVVGRVVEVAEVLIR